MTDDDDIPCMHKTVHYFQKKNITNIIYNSVITVIAIGNLHW